MKRYTGKSLEADLVSLNQTLESQRNLETGSPKECLNACNAFVGSEALNVLRKQTVEAAKS